MATQLVKKSTSPSGLLFGRSCTAPSGSLGMWTISSSGLHLPVSQVWFTTINHLHSTFTLQPGLYHQTWAQNRMAEPQACHVPYCGYWREISASFLGMIYEWSNGQQQITLLPYPQHMLSPTHLPCSASTVHHTRYRCKSSAINLP